MNDPISVQTVFDAAPGFVTGCALFVGAFVTWRQRRRSVSWTVTALALAAIGLGWAGAVRGAWFDEPARLVVERTGWPATLRAADRELVEWRELPEDTFDSLLRQFGWAEEEEPAPPEPPAGPGPLERSLLPHLLALVALGLRLLAMVTAVLTFLIALVWGIASGRSTRQARLKDRVAALEAALEQLEVPPGARRIDAGATDG